MKFAYFLLGIFAISSAYANSDRAINGVLAKELEGKKYRVFKHMAALETMEKLNDGQEVTLSEVEAHPEFDIFRFYILDDGGNRVFNKKYTMRDLGLIDSRFDSISLTVNETAVHNDKDDILHGNLVPLEKRFDGTYEPVKVFLSTFNSRGKVIAKQVATNFFIKDNYKHTNLDYGISFSCTAQNQIAMTIKWDYPWYLPKTEDVHLYFPYNVEFKLDGNFHLTSDNKRFDAYGFTVTPEIERQLLQSKAGALRIPLHQWSTARYTWKSNGLAEAYSRVKYFCKD
ncbi:hypothetical protein OQJ62_14160 [Microbulbifer thermotolerans]|uniref:hypothetical protein n=1 Tax=Microbulbifer thermotolerans TaxID=252514 RepID=UPI002248A4B8|nr:hypothetical protein [Microbulbifer thermotolerans]MCX2796067.1 hypothetical protein [Microbulbifer thermotolerans]